MTNKNKLQLYENRIAELKQDYIDLSKKYITALNDLFDKSDMIRDLRREKLSITEKINQKGEIKNYENKKFSARSRNLSKFARI